VKQFLTALLERYNAIMQVHENDGESINIMKLWFEILQNVRDVLIRRVS
jgi:hypothetical protein